MSGGNAEERVLALDVRSRKFGFAVFEGPNKLLDWGVRSYAPQYGPLDVTVRKRIVSLLEIYLPSLMAIRVPSNSSKRKNDRTKVAVRTLEKHARLRSVTVLILGRKKIKRFFLPYQRVTKHEVASFVAERFHDLAWKLPPKRKPWDAEPYNMTIFDAAAVGVAYFGRR